MQKPEVDMEKECRNCLHRKTGWTCGNPQSSHFEQKVSGEETCGNFAESAGQAHFIRAMSRSFMMLNTKNPVEREQCLHSVLDHYDAAIAAGIPKEDEVQARIGIAAACALVVAHRSLANKSESALESEEGRRVLLEMATAGELERRYRLDEVTKNWYQLSKVDGLIAFKASIIQQEQSTADSERFLRQQLEVFDYINPTPLPASLLLLGKFLMRQNKSAAAADCFQNVLNSLSRKEARFLGNTESLRKDASARLEQLTTGADQGRVSAGTGSTETKAGVAPQKTGCFIATAVYGSELAPEIVLLKKFRDKILLPHRASRSFVSFYYRVSPPIADFIARRPGLGAAVRLVIILPAVKMAKLFLRQI